jgi:hypothetical protein
MADEPKRKVVASKDFAVVYANAIRFRVGDNDGAVTFLVETDGQDGTLYNLEQVQVIMTPRVMKILHMVLGDGIAALEKLLGAPIQIPASVTENIRRDLTVQTPPKK